MSWCDKLSSTPAVGFRINPHHLPSDSILLALAPILDDRVDQYRQHFKIERVEAFSVQFVTDDGYQYAVDPQRMHVEFVHRMQVKLQSGSAPTVEMLSRPRPYTALLSEVSTRVIDAFGMLPGAGSRRVERVGIVSTTRVAIDDCPPGVRRFIQYVGRPWNSDLSQFDCQLTSQLAKTDDYTDNCIHHLIRPHDPEELMTIKLDWQRTFAAAKPVTLDPLKKIVANAQAAALKYFEDVGEGGRFDESVINRSS